MFGICQSLMKLSSTHFDIRHMTRSNYCISWWLHFLLFHLCAISCVDVHGEKKFKIKWKIFVHWVMLAFRNQPLTEKKKLTNEVAAMKRINEWKKSKYTQTHTHAYINKRNAMNKFISATNNNKSKMKRSNFMSYLLLLATNYQFIVELKRTDRMEKEKKERTGSCCMESDFFLLHSIWCVLCIDSWLFVVVCRSSSSSSWLLLLLFDWRKNEHLVLFRKITIRSAHQPSSPWKLYRRFITFGLNLKCSCRKYRRQSTINSRTYSST